MTKTKLVELELELTRTTEKAYAVQDGSDEYDHVAKSKRKPKIFWLPKSQVEMHEEGNKTIFVMPEWLAMEKGLI